MILRANLALDKFHLCVSFNKSVTFLMQKTEVILDFRVLILDFCWACYFCEMILRANLALDKFHLCVSFNKSTTFLMQKTEIILDFRVLILDFLLGVLFLRNDIAC
jgi:hypothetical protein